MKVLLILLIVSFSVTSKELLTFKEIKDELTTEVKKVKIEAAIKKTKVQKTKDYKKEFEEIKKKLDAYRYVSMMQNNQPLMLHGDTHGEGDIIGAQTLLGVMASNTPNTILVGSFKGSHFPEGAKISCEVMTKYKRVCGTCNRLIIDGKGQDINAELKNKDGSNCVIGTLVDSKDKYLTGIALAEIAKGALAISQGSIPTMQGNLIENSASNKMKQAFINTGDTASEMMQEEYQTHEPLVILQKNTRVIIQFKQGVKL